MPLPKTYRAKAKPSDTILDRRHSRSIVYILEDWVSALLPFLIGILVTVLAVRFVDVRYFSGLYDRHGSDVVTLLRAQSGLLPISVVTMAIVLWTTSGSE